MNHVQNILQPENDYGELLTGETTISFASLELANSNLRNGFIVSKQANKPFGIELGLVTENVHQVIEKAIELGANIVEEPKEKPWGQTVGYMQDLDGFLLEICTPVNA